MAAFEHPRIGARHTGRVDTSLALADTVAIEHANRVRRNATAVCGGGMPVRTGGRGQHHHGCRGKHQHRGDGSSASHVPARMVTDTPHDLPSHSDRQPMLGSINGHLPGAPVRVESVSPATMLTARLAAVSVVAHAVRSRAMSPAASERGAPMTPPADTRACTAPDPQQRRRDARPRLRRLPEPAGRDRAPPSRPRCRPATASSTPPPRTATSARSAKASAAPASPATRCSSRRRSGSATTATTPRCTRSTRAPRKLGVDQIDLLLLHQPLPSASTARSTPTGRSRRCSPTARCARSA